MKDIYQAITDQIIAKLEQGVAPWVMPWENGSCGAEPTNYKTKDPYHGINSLMFSCVGAMNGYKSNYWLTFKQALDLGGCVIKGEKGVTGIFFSKREIEDKDIAGEPKVIPMARSFHCFNLDQIEGIEVEATAKREPARDEQIEEFIKVSGADIRFSGGIAGYYKAHDMIQIPERERFKTAHDFYATVTHELIHWTGHESRLDRVFGVSRFDDNYAKEELVAEIGSAFLTARLGLKGDCQHESYIAQYLKVLKNDKRAIVSAASKAQAAADYLFNIYREQVLGETVGDSNSEEAQRDLVEVAA